MFVDILTDVCLYGAFEHTHYLLSLTHLQLLSFSPAAEESFAPCDVCGFYKHLQGTGN